MNLLLQNKWFWFCIGIFILEEIVRIVKPKIKGAIGEGMVSWLLSQLPKEQYMTIHNVMLKTARGTAQIDHVVVSIYGIFVIEVKNYAGWITGKEESNQWTQTIYKKKTHFMNPILQNYGHVKAIETILSDPTIPIYSIVTFSADATLKVQVNNSNVIKYGHLKDMIRSLSTEKVMDEYKMRDIAKLLEINNVDNAQNRIVHVKTIHAKKAEIQNGICPWCGGKLVVRQGKYGIFIGCSNYPKCHYTEKL